MKFCSRCKINKNNDNFYTNTSRKDGLATYCIECQNEYSRLRYASPDQYKQRKMSEKENKIKRKGSSRKWYLKSTYNLTIDQYNKMLINQSGLCDICEVQITSEKYFDVDHDHSCCSGYKSCGNCVRGLICFNCNSVLGHSKDSINILEKTITYIKKYHNKDFE